MASTIDYGLQNFQCWARTMIGHQVSKELLNEKIWLINPRRVHDSYCFCGFSSNNNVFF
jgi:hypothetical protein